MEDTTLKASETVQPKVEDKKKINIFEVNKKVEGIAQSVDNLANIVANLIKDNENKTPPAPFLQGPTITINSSDSTSTVPATTYTTSSSFNQEYVPPRFRQIADEVLSPEFLIQIKDFTDRTDFEVTIIVPDEYSSLTALEKQSGMKDIRTKVIARALGETGVREWCQKVRDNLNKFYASSGVKSPFTSK